MTRSPSPSPAPLHLVSTRDIPAAAAPDTVLERAFAAAAEGRIPAAAAQLEADLGQEPHALSPLRRAAFELMSGIAQMVRGDYEEALRRVLPALPPLEASAHATQLAWAYTAIGFGLGSLGDPERGLEWVGRAIALAEREQQPINALKALSDQGCLLGMLESHDAACRALESSLAVARRLCLPWRRPAA